MLYVSFGNFFVLSEKFKAIFSFHQYTKQLLQSSFSYNNCTHVTFLKSRAYVKNQSGTTKKCAHYHKICSYLTVPYAYCNVLSPVSLKTQYDNGSGFISTFFISFWRLWTDNAIVLKNSWMNTYVACCPSCEKTNIYLPQVPHKATGKRVFETRFLYIKEKKKQ